MNITTKSSLKLIFIFSTLMLFGCQTADRESDEIETIKAIVLLKFKAQPGMGDETVAELIKLIERVKEEPHFICIKLHVDPVDKTNILLYEAWDNLSYYKSDHMNTDHLKEFQSNSVNLLTGPPEISFWNVEKVFKN